MSDETRTVTVAELAAAMAKAEGDFVGKESLWTERAAAIFAALPVATAGPEPESRSIQRRKAVMRGEPMPTFLGGGPVDDLVDLPDVERAALRDAAAQADGGNAPEACDIPGVHHHQIASGMSIQFQPGHPISEIPEHFR